MKRSVLYEKVWATPMTRLSTELGISDVGLAKACRRHGIPAPPRGYWAKLQAGHQVEKVPLPNPQNDAEVQFSVVSPEMRARLESREHKQAEWLKDHRQTAESKAPLHFAQSLDDAHPLVKMTMRYCHGIPGLERKWSKRSLQAWNVSNDEERPPYAQHGRYSLLSKGCLNVTASLNAMDWVLRFHATIFTGLVEAGVKISRREALVRSRGHEEKPAAIEAAYKGESFELEFSEGYKRTTLSDEEVLRRRKANEYVPTYETVPSGNFVFRISGTEYQARKQWQGTGEKLEAKVDEIVRALLEFAALQPHYREERETAAAAAQREAERREAERRTSEARAEQLKHAFAMAEEQERIARLRGFLGQLDERMPELQEPYKGRLEVWLRVVRAELNAKNAVDTMLTQCLTVPHWQTWPPAWWPADPDAKTPEAEEDAGPEAR
ncbi:MAG: hypothetical protein K0Q43_1020 [Ramlibacter sp.]|jgi:hypothetical protein|nr:hypothetical protein [Ramlibacter sp.]